MNTEKPNIYYYNPSCEMAVGNGLPHYQAPALVSQLEKDLSFLMVYLSKPEDWVLLAANLSDTFRTSIQKAGFILPQLIDAEQFFFSEKYLKAKKQSFEPWGISPVVLNKVKPHFSSFCRDYRNSNMSVWKASFRQFFSRETSLNILTQVLNKNPKGNLLPTSNIPKVCGSIEHVEMELKRHQKIILKAPWSSSGRGALFLNEPRLNNSNRQWIQGIVKAQGFIMAEPLLNNRLDFSFHFKVGDGGIDFLGTTCFKTNQRGQYVGSYLEAYPEFVTREFGAYYNSQILKELSAQLQQALQEHQLSREYRGVLGIDAMLCMDENDQFYIHPCVEINLRYNMGTITLALRDMFPESKGFWKTVYAPKGQLINIEKQLKNDYPPVFAEGRLKSGFLPLTPMEEGVKFASFLMLNTNANIV